MGKELKSDHPGAAPRDAAKRSPADDRKEEAPAESRDGEAATQENGATAAPSWLDERLPVLRDVSNATFLPLFRCESRYLVLKGGGGSGKSIFAGRKLLERAIFEGGHRFLVCRKVGKTLRNSCFQQLLGQLKNDFPDVTCRSHQSAMRLSFPDSDSEIIFSGLDDVEKLKSIYNITGIWIEEASELLEGDFNQLDIRLRGVTEHYKQIILTFNPVNIRHWLKSRFFDRCNDDATVHESTYRDNAFLDDEAKAVLEGFREVDAYYYAVYCLGQWGVTGKTVFPAAAVSRRLETLDGGGKQGMFCYEESGGTLGSIRFVEEDGGPVTIYVPPEPGHPYVIGGDTAGDGSDYGVLQCLDNSDLDQVAVVRQQHIDEDVFAAQAFCLGRYYNDALIAIETNWSTYPVLELERLRYPKQYVREAVDSYTHRLRSSFGFRTDAKTRPVIIADLIKTVRADIDFVRDRATLEEMLTFVRNESLRPEAEAGAHDDCIMALAIAIFAGSQQRRNVEAAPKSVWTEDMKEDYAVASAADRQELRRRWGPPQW